MVVCTYIYIYIDMPSVFRSLDFFFRWLFSFLPFTKSTMVNHYGSTICKSKENIFMKSTPTPLGYHHGASVFRSRKSYQGALCVEQFRWCLAGGGIFFPWPSTKQPVELPAVLIEIFIQPFTSRRVVEMLGRLVTWWFICSRPRGLVWITE